MSSTRTARFKSRCNMAMVELELSAPEEAAEIAEQNSASNDLSRTAACDGHGRPDYATTPSGCTMLDRPTTRAIQAPSARPTSSADWDSYRAAVPSK